MGGQACVFYGAAEFSCDTDLSILATAENLVRLKKALTDLQADVYRATIMIAARQVGFSLPIA